MYCYTYAVIQSISNKILIVLLHLTIILDGIGNVNNNYYIKQF